MRREKSHKEMMNRNFDDFNHCDMLKSYETFGSIEEIDENGIVTTKLGEKKYEPTANDEFKPEDFMIENLLAINAVNQLKERRISPNLNQFEQSINDLCDTIDEIEKIDVNK